MRIISPFALVAMVSDLDDFVVYLDGENMDNFNQDLFPEIQLNAQDSSTAATETPGLNAPSVRSGSFFTEATAPYENWFDDFNNSNSRPYSPVSEPRRPPVNNAPQPRVDNIRPPLVNPPAQAPVLNGAPSALAHLFTLLHALESDFQIRLREIRIAVEKAILELLERQFAAPPAGGSSTIDLSRDPRPGAKALLAAQKAAEKAQLHTFDDPTIAQQGVPIAPSDAVQSTDRPPSGSGVSTDSRSLREPHNSSTVDPSLDYHSLAGKFGTSGNFGPSDPIAPLYPYPQSNAFAFSSIPSSAQTPHTTGQGLANNSSRSRRTSQGGAQAAAVDGSTRKARKVVSSRSSGPTDLIEGMVPGAGADRLLAIQRAGLPKGNINGKSYSCEAKCGYDDSASSQMINCDSSFHRRQRRLKLPGGNLGDRGWYHRACGGLPVDGEAPRTWICPSCMERGTVSTDGDGFDDNDDGDDGQNDNSGPDGGEDSEDDYEPGHDTPGDDSDDGEGGNENEERRDKGTKKNKIANRKRYILDEDNDNQNDNQPGNLASSTENQGQLNGRAIRKRYILDSDDESGTQKAPTKTQLGGVSKKSQSLGSSNEARTHKRPVKTEAGTIWNEEEKVMAIDFMREIVQEGKITGETRFAEIARRMRLRGHNRAWTSVKNAWNRGLRERSGIDERKNKKAPLTTSKQDNETKKRNQLEKQNRQRSSSETDNQQSLGRKSASPKREHQSQEGDEVIPPKRRRAPPYDGDYFPGVP